MRRGHPPSERGNTLLVTIVLVGVLTVVAAGMLRRSWGEMESAAAKRTYDASLSCADGAREMLLSQFRSYGVVLTSLQLDQTVGGRRYASGHYDRFGVQTIVPVDRALVAGGSDNAIDLTNRAQRVSIGGAYYRITVVCSDSRGADRQSEVEYIVRFGL